jgi:hypothetical protein
MLQIKLSCVYRVGSEKYMYVGRQGPVIELLTMYKASTNCEDEALECYNAANRYCFESSVVLRAFGM